MNEIGPQLDEAWDRTPRLTPAATRAACALICLLLSGCIDHSLGRPYSGTASLLKAGAEPPWYCYGGAPTETSALVERMGYTTAFASVFVVNAIGETLILPVDLVEKPRAGLPLPQHPTCGPQPPYPHPPLERDAPAPPAGARDAAAHGVEASPASSG